MITIIDYNAGNIKSVTNALDSLNVKYEITADPNKILATEKIIFPGVGAAGSAMQNLKKTQLDKIIPQIKVPFLGICLGMQILLNSSEEDQTECLGIFDGKVKKFQAQTPDQKIPHMGWNQVQIQSTNPLFKDIPNQSFFYFVHSYYCDLKEPKEAIGQTEYIHPFDCAANKNNFYATQFHPEKSGEIGLKLLKNFVEL